MKKLLTSAILLCVTTLFAQTTQVPMSKLVRPSYLSAGDTIAIVAPAGVVSSKKPTLEAKKIAESWGLHVLIGTHVFEDGNHFAGSDLHRTEDLQKALDNPSIKAIWCARGGYGTVRIIDQLDFTKFKSKPKWIVGYSDITVLHSHLNTLGFETLQGMMTNEMQRDSSSVSYNLALLKKALMGEQIAYTIEASNYNKPGKAKGTIVGGNLSILQSLLGSNSSIDTTDKIIFIEEIGEYKYELDRMLNALKRAGYFENCKGLVVGGMTKIKKNTTSYGLSTEELVLNILKEYDFPVMFDFPAGHDKINEPVFLGREVEINVRKEKVSLTYLNGGAQ